MMTLTLVLILRKKVGLRATSAVEGCGRVRCALCRRLLWKYVCDGAEIGRAKYENGMRKSQDIRKCLLACLRNTVNLFLSLKSDQDINSKRQLRISRSLHPLRASRFISLSEPQT